MLPYLILSRKVSLILISYFYESWVITSGWFLLLEYWQDVCIIQKTKEQLNTIRIETHNMINRYRQMVQNLILKCQIWYTC